MMTALLLYGYCNGVYSSRRIAKAARERVDFLSIVGLDPPDFRTVSDFRKRHLKVLAGLFGQVLKLCVSMAPRFSSKVAPQNSPVWPVWAVSGVGDRRLRSLAAGHDGSGSAEWDLRRWA
jgi:hypothetical protein